MQKTLEMLERDFNKLSSEEIDYLRLVMNSLLNREQLSLTAKKLIIKMAIREKCEYYGYPIVDVDFCMINDPKGGHYDYKTNKIIINSSIFSNKAFGDATSYPFFAGQSRELDRLLFIANHECEHYFQHFDYKNGILSRKSFSWCVYSLINKYTSKNSKGQSEYQVNYGYKEIENYANIQGWYDTGLFLARHNALKSNQEVISQLWMQSSARQNISSQVGKDGKRAIIEDYNIRELISIVYKHPSLMDQIPILAIFFYGQNAGEKKGERKDLNDLLSQYQMLEQQYGAGKRRSQVEEEKFVYRQFFYYLIGKDASMVPPQYSDVLYELALYELISLQGLFDINDIQNKQNEQNEQDKPKERNTSYKKISRIKVNRLITFSKRVKDIATETNNSELWDKLKNMVNETLKVYETSKLMYGYYDADVEECMQEIRQYFDLFNIEHREPDGRKSAINI